MKTIFSLAILFILATNSYSQDTQSQAQKMTDSMKKDLSLNEDQVTRVLPVNQAFVESLQALRNNSGGKLTKYRKFKAADSERDKALKSILTSEQYTLFKQRKEENREALKEARKSKNG